MKIPSVLMARFWAPAMLGISLVCLANPVFAESPGAGSTGQGSMESQDIDDAAASGQQGTKASPPFREVDKNGDHYVTKDELNGYPRLLERFDEADAGKDGKLEQHEYANLVMEKKQSGYR